MKNIILRILLIILIISCAVPAVRYGVIGEVPAITLSYTSPPEWSYTILGLACCFCIVFSVFLLINKSWARWGLAVGVIPFILVALVNGSLLFMSIAYALISVVILLISICWKNSSIAKNANT